MVVMFILMMLIGLIIGVFLDRLISSKEERIEKEYVKVLKNIIEEDLQKNAKKRIQIRYEELIKIEMIQNSNYLQVLQEKFLTNLWKYCNLSMMKPI